MDKDADVDLLPCPFCGGSPVRHYDMNVSSKNYGEFMCIECGACGCMIDTPEMWNRRTETRNELA